MIKEHKKSEVLFFCNFAACRIRCVASTRHQHAMEPSAFASNHVRPSRKICFSHCSLQLSAMERAFCPFHGGSKAISSLTRSTLQPQRRVLATLESVETVRLLTIRINNLENLPTSNGSYRACLVFGHSTFWKLKGDGLFDRRNKLASDFVRMAFPERFPICRKFTRLTPRQLN